MTQIYGAGLAGLLAGNMLQLRGHEVVVYEKQPELPNNHSALLRFGSPIIGDVLNIPFKKVKMIKSTVPWRNDVADALAYSKKCSGHIRSDRSLSGYYSGERWIAPPNLIELMSRNLKFVLGEPLTATHKDQMIRPIISTIPMPALMNILEFPDKPKFEYVPGINIRATVSNCEAYVTLYIPDPALMANRISITGNELIIEIALPNGISLDSIGTPNLIISAACNLLGIDRSILSNFQVHEQKYAKIQPINDGLRKSFLHWATDKFNIFSLGRFATWRPGLVLDDLVKDIRLIEQWISGERYGINLNRK